MSRASLVSGDVRRHNLTLVLEHIVRSGPSARSEIATATGLTKGAVTLLVNALTDAGVLAETDPLPSAKGRPITRLELVAAEVAILVAQLDADTATALLTSLAGEELFRVSTRHGRPMGDPAAVLDVLGDVTAEALEAASDLGRRVVELPVVVFAPVGGEPPVVIADTDLGWDAVDVLAALRERVPALPTVASLASDGWLAALAERSLLPGVDEVVYLKSNSGIGGAIVSGGRLVEGAHGVGGALGHLAVVPGGDRCACGQHGCLVTVAGPDVLLARAGIAGLVTDHGLAAALDELSARITAGEPRAAAAWADALPWIARTMQILSLATDPEVIVIGGFWSAHTASIDAAFRENRPAIAAGFAATSEVPAIMAGRLGADAALLGAAWAARDRVLADPLNLAV
ncbi:ROK family transcriptional regulator [Agromyces sp. SYSU K20354]|uniref:ROK family transcriptional regulator n=1 Tax=Agromyces cavernae TaxID=2898659 RepID=UPI001E45E50D|nr:ROK family transcriptional regulator [Agromyces cavernae]MCD2442056.1 ROK family transcriptional regulator [Agromyces cavernae]